jgi:hypothetical protein
VKQTPRDTSNQKKAPRLGPYQNVAPRLRQSDKGSLNSTQQFTKKSLKTHGSQHNQSNQKKQIKVGKYLKFDGII